MYPDDQDIVFITRHPHYPKMSGGGFDVWSISRETCLQRLEVEHLTMPVSEINSQKDLLVLSTGTTEITKAMLSVWSWKTGKLLWKHKAARDTPDGTFPRGPNFIEAQMIWDGKILVGTREGLIQIYELQTG
jgi:hypothetical protein